MKPLGPYVAARDLPGRMTSPVRTLRATDRLTGMPVLLHALPSPLAIPDLPEHPNVLMPVDCVQIATEAFMVTELPLQARPAQDPDLTAQGALAALAALHARGVVHGGLSASQLWSVDGEVRLAGAGLPWGGEPRPQDDLYALAVILHEMGGVPRALRPLLDEPGRLDARAALAALRVQNTPAPAPLPQPSSEPAATPVTPVPVPPSHPAAGDPVPGPAPRDRNERPPAPSAPASGEKTEAGARGRRERGRRSRQSGRDAAASSAGAASSAEAVSPAPAITDTPDAAPPSGGRKVTLGSAAPDQTAPVPTTPDPTPAPQDAPATPEPTEPPPAHDGTPIVLGEPEPATPARSEAPPTPSEPAPSRPAAVAPGGPAEERPARPGRISPQERRRREHEARREQTERDAQAAAERRQQTAAPAAPHTPPPPLQIGFDDLPAWEADSDGADAPRPALNLREVERLPPSLRRAPADDRAVREAEPVGTIPARRRTGEPIRIGWDEDDSWRVVREAPAAAVRPRRPLLWRVLFWGALAAGFVVVVTLLGGLVRDRQARAASPQATVNPSVPARQSSGGQVAAPQPQTVPFTVRGVAGATARLSVEQAPKAANIAPGASLGTAPGRVTFPAPGTYRLRVVVDGYAPGSMTVTVPRAQPVTIDLDR